MAVDLSVSPVAVVTGTGISAPAFPDVLAWFQTAYQSIYGSDVSLDPSTQDGQWLAILAKVVSDANAMAVATYNAFSPATAQGTGLSSVVKINGLERLTPSNSTADLTIVGQAGTIILNGLVGDEFQNQWALPAKVTIPPEGQIVETATCTTSGAISAAAASITKIINPTLGWQSATNIASATVGAPLESDATLRKRRAASTALPALTVLEAIVGRVENLPGVQAVASYENDTGTTDGNGIPGHSFCLVVEAGDSVQIATAIAQTKTAAGTYGTTSETIIDQNGVPTTINFFRPTPQRVVATVNLSPKTGYLSSTGVAIQQAMANLVAGLPNGAIGVSVPWFELVGACNLGAPLNATYTITSVTIGIFGGSQSAADIAIAFNEQPGLAVADITVNVA